MTTKRPTDVPGALKEVVEKLKTGRERETLLGVKSEGLVSAPSICASLSNEELILVERAAKNELAKRTGEVPTEQERWLVQYGDKITAVKQIRKRLGCDLNTALRILELAEIK